MKRGEWLVRSAPPIIRAVLLARGIFGDVSVFYSNRRRRTTEWREGSGNGGKGVYHNYVGTYGWMHYKRNY